MNVDIACRVHHPSYKIGCSECNQKKNDYVTMQRSKQNTVESTAATVPPVNKLLVIACGAIVWVGDDFSIKATVTGVNIRGTNVYYCCTWWDKNQMVERVLESFLVKYDVEHKSIRIGFLGVNE